MKDFLNNFYKVDDPIMDKYLSHWQEYSRPKKTIMTEEGKTERYIYFVLDGIQKSYYLNNGKQHIMFFAYSPSFSGIMESFFTQTPSKYYLETITDSTFLRLSFTQHNRLIEEHRELETLFRKISEYFLLGIIERHHEFLAYNTEERFKIFSQRSPHLFGLVSQNDLASYLRIDPTNFSKLMNRIHIQ